MGLQRVFPIVTLDGTEVTDKNARKAADNALCDLVSRHKKISILLASGYRHIGYGAKPGLLLEALRGSNKPDELEVLLLDPCSDSAAKRAATENIKHEDYKNGVAAVLYTLRDLQDAHGIKVSVRLYSDAPIWQMLLTESELWLLCANGRAADESPLFCFVRTAKYSLALGLSAVWERRWNSETTRELDWSEVEMPKLADVYDATSTPRTPSSTR